MLLINIVMGLNVLLGQYSNLFTAKVAKVALRMYCICICVGVTYLTTFHFTHLSKFDLRGFAICVLVTGEYIFWCIMSHINCQAYISSYTRAILSCDTIMGHKKSVLENNSLIILVFLNIFINSASIFCDAVLSEFWSEWISRYGLSGFLVLLAQSVMLDSADLSILRVNIVAGMLQNRLMKMRHILKGNTIPLHNMTKDEIESKVNVVKRCLLNYKNLLDSFDDVYTHLHLIMVVAFSVTGPELVLVGYTFIKEVIFKNILWRIMIVDAIRCLVKIVSPCIIFELCYSEVDHIKMLLVKQITQSKDAELREELERAMDYVTRRPFRFTLLRTFRVDVELPVTFLAVAGTYTILLIEFSHFVL